MQKKFASTIDLRTGTALQYLGACLPVMLLALTTETREIIWHIDLVAALIWSIFVMSFGAIFLLMWLIREGSVSKVSSLFYLVPAVAAVMAYFLFDERLAPVQLAGMILCGLAVFLATKTAQSASQTGK